MVDAVTGSSGGWLESTDPEEKRKIVGDEFIRVFEEEAPKLGRIDFLTQGTLYPTSLRAPTGDESRPKIKTHHNVGGLPETCPSS